MRFAALALLLSACATSQALSPPERVLGCWVERSELVTTTLNWSAGAEAGRVSGQLTTRNARETVSLPLRLSGDEQNGWQVCGIPARDSCFVVAQGASGSLEGGRAFIDRYGERLHLSIVDGNGGDLVRFVGESAACS